MTAYAVVIRQAAPEPAAVPPVPVQAARLACTGKPGCKGRAGADGRCAAHKEGPPPS